MAPPLPVLSIKARLGNGWALPLAAGVVQGMLFHGMARGSRWVEKAAGHPLAYLFLAALAAPLVVAAVVVLRRRAGTSA